ncbi:MAG: hypothetical protein WB681_14515 [Candidatus Cybelea sp.]
MKRIVILAVDPALATVLGDVVEGLEEECEGVVRIPIDAVEQCERRSADAA